MKGIEQFHIRGSGNEPGELIGRVKAPRGTVGFLFITTDTDQLKIGEFVYYKVRDGSGVTRKVLGRTISRQSIREYPDSYLSLREVSPEEILRVTGVDHYQPLFEIEVSIIGYFENDSRFVNPRLPPPQGTEVFLASDSLLRNVLGKGGRRPGTALVGHLLNRPEQRVPISLEVGELVSKHLAILAATGSGKSYTVGVLLEELMGIHNRAAVLVFDPHGEYHTLDEMRNLIRKNEGYGYDEGETGSAMDGIVSEYGKTVRDGKDLKDEYRAGDEKTERDANHLRDEYEVGDGQTVSYGEYLNEGIGAGDGEAMCDGKDLMDENGAGEEGGKSFGEFQLLSDGKGFQ